MMRHIRFFFLSLVLLIGAGCDHGTATPNVPASGLTLIEEADSLSVRAEEADRKTARDVLAAIQENSGAICADLQTGCQFPVTVEIYPDQASFDEHVMNPEMRGFFAVSGQPSTIQMVSPAHPAPHQIAYQDGVKVAIHEFAHLVLDEINPDMPAWLDEGTAIYAGPHEPYTTVCQTRFPFDRIPSFHQLESDYNGVSAPDLFAYTAVDFIAREYGMEKLNALLRSPGELEEILGISEETFEDNWVQFMQTAYRN